MFANTYLFRIFEIGLTHYRTIQLSNTIDFISKIYEIKKWQCTAEFGFGMIERVVRRGAKVRLQGVLHLEKKQEDGMHCLMIVCKTRQTIEKRNKKLNQKRTWWARNDWC